MARNVYPLSTVAKEMNNIVSSMIQQYGEGLQKETESVTKAVAEDFAQELKQVTPRSTDLVSEHMADTVQVTKKKSTVYGVSSTSFIVHYNKWQLGHLLEFGWTTKNGKRINRKPFMRPLFDRNKEKYARMYKEALDATKKL